MKHYDPEVAPDPEEWLELDEQERIRLVERYHRAARIKLPSVKAHAAFQVTVENQLAQGLESAVRAMQRLTAEGLSRHDALHAIASVVADFFYEAMNTKDEEFGATVEARYNTAVERLTVKEWHRKYEEEE